MTPEFNSKFKEILEERALALVDTRTISLENKSKVARRRRKREREREKTKRVKKVNE